MVRDSLRFTEDFIILEFLGVTVDFFLGTRAVVGLERLCFDETLLERQSSQSSVLLRSTFALGIDDNG